MIRLLTAALLLMLCNGTAQAQTPAVTGHLTPDLHAQSIVMFQKDLNTEFANPKESPLTEAERRAFSTLPYYPTNYNYYVTAKLVRDSTAQPFAMETSTAQRPLYRKYGELCFMLNGQALRLSVYQNQELLNKPGLEDYLFVPFTDLTNGKGSYGGGRYLDLRVPPAGTSTMELDFNRAYNPSCAYNHGYSCPVPPVENRLAADIPAGVRSDR